MKNLLSFGLQSILFVSFSFGTQAMALPMALSSSLNASFIGETNTVLMMKNPRLIGPGPVLLPFVAPTPYPADAIQGQYATSATEYRLPAAMDASVLPGVVTEIWGKAYYPTQAASITGPLPLIVLLHGNHTTCTDGNVNDTNDSCEYTFTGSCPSGKKMVPNYLGYEYFATRLASFGYLVVSINANRGITCGNAVAGDSGLNLARGRLILRHLAYLSQWSTKGGQPASLGMNLRGKIDFSQVGLFGHSRAGEGVRAAYNLYKDVGSLWPATIGSALTIKGIFEVGPVDGQTSRILDAVGTAWNVLLPSCDGDVSNLQGMKPYDRMMSAHSEAAITDTQDSKSMFLVYGANHDFYNTEWTASDSAGCVAAAQLWKENGGSVTEQDTATRSVIPFFRAHVGVAAVAANAAMFDTTHPLPAEISAITRVDRAFISSPSTTFTQSFDNFTGVSNVVKNNVSFVTSTVPEHDPTFRAGKITWSSGGSATSWEDRFAQGGLLDKATSLDFRLGRTTSSLNTDPDLDFQIQAVFSDQSLSLPVRASQFITLSAVPGGIVTVNGATSTYLHEVLTSVRIPISDLTSNTTAEVVGVKFTFNQSRSGEIFVSDLLLSHSAEIVSHPVITDPVPPISPTAPQVNAISRTLSSLSSAAASATTTLANAVSTGIKELTTRTEISSTTPLANGQVEIEVESSVNFQVRDALPVLMINGSEAAVGSFSRPSDLHFMKFTLNPSDLNALPETLSLEVAHREDANGPVRSLGTVLKSSLQLVR
jgi:hypothetical protein